MSTPSVNVNNLNLAQGPVDGVERYFLFCGSAANTGVAGQILQIGMDSNLDTLLGNTASELKTQLTAARTNGGQNWRAAAYVYAAGEDWEDAIDAAMGAGVNIEAVMVCTPVTAAANLTAMHAKAMSILSTYMRWIWILASFRGINATTETWSDYITAATAIPSGVAGYRVGIVPLLHGNNLGVVAGRLANQAQSIADTPMRVASGPVLGLGATPVDMNAEPLGAEHLSAMDAQRFSVPWEYPGYPGTYWADCNLLDVPAGDYQVVENLRVVDKAARQVYPRCVAQIGNRELNNTPPSIAYHQGYFMKPLRDMAKTTVFQGKTFPGDIQPPTDGDIIISWVTTKEVHIFLSCQPYNSPKKIVANIALDLS